MITTYRVISCEGRPSGQVCGAHLRDEVGDESEAELRARAQAEGWHHTDDGRDICGPCWKEGAR
ncbi:hypothetical protein [Streptomyces sp. DH37]|uniref:hypothetical protein n=1 Tax=Streptomyces sp. DH37 TaxID=3040122 RepID=UPI002441BC62|nr:hypothetical protein [Streptomyces sp. DH37]MDG9703747.1 hypothetical protein [Streptomyces sp. DH37]